jgi:hypothetical protein
MIAHDVNRQRLENFFLICRLSRPQLYLLRVARMSNGSFENTFSDASSTLNLLKGFRDNPSACQIIDFITPLLAVSLCGACIGKRLPGNQVRFSDSAESYAQNYGLLESLGQSLSAEAGNQPLHGQTYCKIQKILVPDHVDHCNQILSGLLKTQLARCKNQRLVASTYHVIGEIHDNVASHARGCGFSAAQVYTGKRKRIQIAVADIGQGIGGSVRSAGAKYLEWTDRQALEWCLVKGNTVAKLTQPKEDLLGPQRIDFYSNYNPYPPETAISSDTNHHMGEGLFRLVELIRETRGKTWIWSGHASMLNDKGSTIWLDPGFDWKGTIVAIEIPIDAFESSPVAENAVEFEKLARRLRL